MSKYPGWTFLIALVLSMVALWEVCDAIHGPSWAVNTVVVLLSLLWLGFVSVIAGWADRKMAEQLRRRLEKTCGRTIE